MESLEQQIRDVASDLADFTATRNGNVDAANALEAIADRVRTLEGFVSHANLRHGSGPRHCSECAEYFRDAAQSDKWDGLLIS